jgi:hypothetical protein
MNTDEHGWGGGYGTRMNMEGGGGEMMGDEDGMDRDGEVGVFVVGEWNGLRQWQCRYCAWDTLEGEEAMLAHYAARHAPAPEPKQARRIQVYDRWGNPVN